MDRTNQRWRAVVRKVFLTGLVLGGILWAHPVAQTVELPFSYIFPQISFEQGWKASVIVTNIGKKATTVQLLAYDTGGTLIQEGLEGIPLNPSEQRNFSSAAGEIGRAHV